MLSDSFGALLFRFSTPFRELTYIQVEIKVVWCAAMPSSGVHADSGGGGLSGAS